MKTISSIKSSTKTTKCESPKTPGGISKAFLTPVRRVGLSKNWRKSGPSPFVSPLSRDSPTITSPAVVEKKPAKKRGRVLQTEDIQDDEDKVVPSKDTENECIEVLETPSHCQGDDSAEIVTTPLRNVQLPHRSKSKPSYSVKSSKDKVSDVSIASCNDDTANQISESLTAKENSKTDSDINIDSGKVEEVVSKPVRKKSIKKNVKTLPQKTQPIILPVSDDKLQNILANSSVLNELSTESSKAAKDHESESNTKPKSPNELIKECIVVIQRKINKGSKLEKPVKKTIAHAEPKENLVSQILFDSDSDDTPLSKWNKKIDNESQKIETLKRPRQLELEEDDDFCDYKKLPPKIKKLEDKSTSSGDLKLKSNREVSAKNSKVQTKSKVSAQRIINVERSSHDSNSFDDEDDDFEMKRTILIRKTYNKYHVVKPQKARSTGSVTQKDIEDLKARIDMKKNLLLAKSVCPDTEELRNLTKKWKKGCQDALQELMELMKNKFPEKQNMDFSEMLQLLQIPSSLVGYNSDDDCFTSPDDAGIILSKFNLTCLRRVAANSARK